MKKRSSKTSKTTALILEIVKLIIAALLFYFTVPHDTKVRMLCDSQELRAIQSSHKDSFSS